MTQQIRTYSQTEQAAHKSRGSYRLFWYIMTPVLVGIFIWLTVSPYGLWKLYKMRQHRDALYQANVAAIKKNTELEENIKRIKTDPVFQEKVVRKTLGWVKPNEILYVFKKKEKK